MCPHFYPFYCTGLFVPQYAGVQVRVVATAELSSFATEGQSFDAMLQALTADQVAASLRDQYGADLTVLIVSDSVDVFCGIGWIMTESGSSFESSAFSVVNAACLADNTLAHEMGHNMGCDHNLESASATQGVPAYAHGFRFCDASEGFTTIMSYTDNCPATRVPYFSSPNANYRGRAVGDEGQANVSIWVAMPEASIAILMNVTTLQPRPLDRHRTPK